MTLLPPPDRSDQPLPLLPFTVAALAILGAAMAVGALLGLIARLRP